MHVSKKDVGSGMQLTLEGPLSYYLFNRQFIVHLVSLDARLSAAVIDGNEIGRF